MRIEHEIYCQQCGFAHDRRAGETYHAQEKECQVCTLTQPLAAFPRSYRSYDGHSLTCLICLPIQPDAVRVDQQAGEVLVIPIFTSDVDLQDVHPETRHWWQTGVPSCTHCAEEIRVTHERDRDSKGYLKCQPVTDSLFADELFCDEDCLNMERDMEWAMSKND